MNVLGIAANPQPGPSRTGLVRVCYAVGSTGGAMGDMDAFGLIVAELRSDRGWWRRVRRIEVSARLRAWCWRALSSAGMVAGAGVLT
jgi:hypothetical protein